MALSGRRTRTVRTAEKLTFCRSREYSSILRKTQNHGGVSWIQWRNFRLSNIIKQTLNANHSQRDLLLHLSHQESLPEELIKACLHVRIKSVRGNVIHQLTQPQISPSLSLYLSLSIFHFGYCFCTGPGRSF